MLLKHVSRYIFQHHHGINDKKKKKKNIYVTNIFAEKNKEKEKNRH